MSQHISAFLAEGVTFLRSAADTAQHLIDQRTPEAIAEGVHLLALAADIAASLERLHASTAHTQNTGA